MSDRGTMSLSLGVLVGIVFLVLIVAFGVLMSQRGKTQVEEQSQVFAGQIRSQLMTANPAAKACAMWMSQGLGMPSAVTYYKVPDASRYAQWGCCDDLAAAESLDAARVSKCLKSCALTLSELERCSADWDIMDNGAYRSAGDQGAQLCYRTRFERSRCTT
jgi:hypothetical protein